MPRRLLSLLAPPLCAVCGDGCGTDQLLCGRCARELAASQGGPLTVPGVDAAWAATAYDGAPRQLVAALKFGRRLALAEIAAEAIAATAPEDWPDAPLVPVPADPLRRRLRGFDSAHEIAIALGRRLGRLALPSLERTHSRRQVGQPRAERLVGPAVRATAEVPRTAVLVDDVITTGSTLAACAVALRAAGSQEILALAFARA